MAKTSPHAEHRLLLGRTGRRRRPGHQTERPCRAASCRCDSANAQLYVNYAVPTARASPVACTLFGFKAIRWGDEHDTPKTDRRQTEDAGASSSDARTAKTLAGSASPTGRLAMLAATFRTRAPDVAALVDAAEHLDPLVWGPAIDQLAADARIEAAQALELLATASTLAGGTPLVQARAARARLIHTTDPTLPFIRWVLDDIDPGVREVAAERYSAMTSAYPALLEDEILGNLVMDQSARVRFTAAELLHKVPATALRRSFLATLR